MRPPSCPARGGIVVPLNVQDRPHGTIKFYYRSPADIDRSQLAIARGFGQLLSTQLSTHELDRQAELTAKAGKGSAGSDQPALFVQHDQHDRCAHAHRTRRRRATSCASSPCSIVRRSRARH